MTTVLDLDETTAPVRGRPPWPWLAALLVAGLLGGLVATLARQQQGPDSRVVRIVFDVEGHATLARVWTRNAPDGDVTPGRVLYVDPTMAVLSVPDGMCRITVDGTVVAERRASAGEPAICAWRD